MWAVFQSFILPPSSGSKWAGQVSVQVHLHFGATCARTHASTHMNMHMHATTHIPPCQKSIRLYFFPAVSNGDRVGKLSIVVEGTFMCMCDLLLPRNTAGCICHCQIAKWCNTCLSHSRFARDDRTLGAATLHQVLSETWGYPSGNNPQNSAGFWRWCSGGGGHTTCGQNG
jgi:hypothetical protein